MWCFKLGLSFAKVYFAKISVGLFTKVLYRQSFLAYGSLSNGAIKVALQLINNIVQ